MRCPVTRNINLIDHENPDSQRPEPELAGSAQSRNLRNPHLEELFGELKSRFPGVGLDYFQSNHEGVLIDTIQQAEGRYDGIVLNAGGYTHTSVALRDAVAAVSVPVVEVHISSILAREGFRHTSMLAPVVRGSIMGFGLDSYRLGVEALLNPVR